MSRTIHLDNSAEQTVTIENLSFGRVRLSESSETGSTAIEMKKTCTSPCRSNDRRSIDRWFR